MKFDKSFFLKDWGGRAGGIACCKENRHRSSATQTRAEASATLAGLATPDVPKQYDPGGIEIHLGCFYGCFLCCQHLKLKTKVIAVLTPVFKIRVKTEVVTAVGSSKLGFTVNLSYNCICCLRLGLL